MRRIKLLALSMNRILVLIMMLSVQGNVLAGLDEGMAAARSGDHATRLKEWRPLAEQGDAEAQLVVATLCLEGIKGVPKDYKEGMKWLRKSANQKYPEALLMLGLVYYEGKGVRQNKREAAKWIRLAAEQGNTVAQNNIGMMYAKSDGILRDYIQAHMWFDIAAKSGDKQAARNRSIAAKKMTPSQIAEAQKLARVWMEKHQ